jgi:hypothetical protein
MYHGQGEKETDGNATPRRDATEISTSRAAAEQLRASAKEGGPASNGIPQAQDFQRNLLQHIGILLVRL